MIFGVYGIYAAYQLGSKLLGNRFSSHSNVRWYYSLHQLSDEVNLKKIKTVLRFDLKVLAEIPATICWHLMRRKASTAWH